MAFRLPRLNQGWRTQPELFERYWNNAMKSIEDNLNNVNEVLGIADGAQSTADQAQSDASTAQDAASSAQDTADNAQSDASTALNALDFKVDKNVGPTFGAVSGTISRSAYTTYQRSGGWAGLTDTQKIEELADGLTDLARVVGAAITDLRNNDSLT